MMKAYVAPFIASDATSIDLRILDVRDLKGVDLELWGQIAAASPVAYSLVREDGTIIGAAGVHFHDDGDVADVWVLTSALVEKYKFSFVKGVLWGLNRAFDEFGIRRLQTLVLTEHDLSIKWLEWMGFEREKLCENCGPNGLNRYLYAKVK